MFKKTLASLAATACLINMSQAMAADASVGGEAVIVTPLSLVKVDDISMGRISAGQSAGTVTLNLDGTRSSTGGVTLIGNDQQTGRFAGQGSVGQTVQVTIPGNATLTGPGADMLLSNMDFGLSPSLPNTYSRVGTTDQVILTGIGGIFGFDVGGELAVGANQTGGTYSSSFTITADYF